MKDKASSIVQLLATAFYAVLWCGGVISYMLWGGPPDNVGWTAPAFLYVAALLVVMTAPTREKWFLAGVALCGYLIEVAGVHTGFPFGTYAYTNVLYPLLFDTPVVMGAAWAVLVAYVRHATAFLKIGPVPCALLGASWMVMIDLVIDPLASGPLGYWSWQCTQGYYGVPWSNFPGWWMTTFVLLLFYPAPCIPSISTTRIGMSIILFFTVLALLHRLWIPVLAGISLCLLHPPLLRMLRSALHQAERPPD